MSPEKFVGDEKVLEIIRVSNRAGHVIIGQVVRYRQCITEKSGVRYRQYVNDLNFLRAVRL